MPKELIDKKTQFVLDIYDYALDISRRSGFPVEFILAQAALETGWGENFTGGSKNLFNIKQHNRRGKSVTAKANEYNDQKVGYKETSKFRAYDSYKESLDDWLDFLQSNPRYHGITDDPEKRPRLDIFDPEIQNDPDLLAVAIWMDGFSTDPYYPDKLIRVLRGPTMKRALEAVKNSHPVATYEDVLKRVERKYDSLSSAERAQLVQGTYGGRHSGETLKRDANDYHVVWRIKKDGTGRGSFDS